MSRSEETIPMGAETNGSVTSAPVVFLDFDGVLNCEGFLERQGVVPGDGASERASERDWERMIDPACVARLDRILEATGAVVVLSTSWRHALPDDRIGAILRGHGFTGHIAGRTAQSTSRHSEIVAYARDHAIERWIAIDDVAMPELGERMLVTEWTGGGLLDEHVERAVAMLGARS